jgi:hypothetical protein
MAARLNNRHQQSVKDRIQASQLVNLLQDHALKGTEVTPSRLDSAKFLLNKVLSNAPIEQYTEMNNVDGYKFIVERAGSEGHKNITD